MKTKFLQHLCYSNVWIALGASTLSLLYFYLKNLSIDWILLSFIFFSTLLTYTYQRFQKLIDNERISGERMDWMKNNRTIVKFILIISLIGTIIFSLFLEFQTLILLSILGVISFLYAYKIKLAEKSKSNLRDIPGIKILLIGIVWAASTVLLIDSQENQLNIFSLLSFVGVTLFIIGITIPFDIRDLYLDESSKKTIPQLIGYQPSILIAVLLILLSAYFIYLGTGFNLWNLLFASGIVSFSILPSRPRKQELYFSFVIDGILIVYPSLIYLLNNL